MKIKKIIIGLRGQFIALIGLGLCAITARADYQNTVLADHPLAYYALDLTIDNGGTATDLSGNGNNSTYFNIFPTAGPTAFIPNAAIFTGSSINSFVDLGTGSNPSLLNFSNTITMEAWAQPASTSVGSGPAADVIGKGYDGTYEITMRAQGGNYYGGLYNGNTYAASGGVQTTNWTYLVSTYDGTNWNLYVNGILVQANPGSVGAVSFSAPWAIGVGSPSGNDRWFAGNICQVALYTNALTAAQVLTHYYSAELNALPGNSLPIINTQPQSQASYVGGSVTFGVVAVSALPATNQWFRGGSPLNGQTNATLTLTNLALGDANNYSVKVGNANGTTNSVAAVLTVSTPASLVWSANANSGIWDTSTSANWINQANSQQVVFNSGDQVLFDDTVGVPTTATLGGTVQPSLITVNSSVNNFSIQRAGDGSGILNGSGSLLKKGTSTLTVNSGGGLTGTATIAGGLVYAGNNSFANLSRIIITNSSTMDIGGGSFNHALPVTISDSGFNGQGAIINSYGDYPSASFNINLTGDATISGSPQRWDLVSGSVTGAHTLTVNGNGDYSLEWNATSIGANVSSIVFTNGKFGIKSLGSSFQNPATAFVVSPNVEFDFWSAGDNGYNGSLTLMSGAATVNIFTGQPLTIGSGATLSYANNTINGDLVIGAGATASSSGVATRSLNVSGNVTLNGSTVIRLNGSGINDTISAGQSITYGGTLNLVNIGTTLAVGNSFPIFSATNYSGSFTFNPPTPGSGLAWQLNGGTLSVVVGGGTGPVVNSTKVSGGNLIFGGTGGTANGNYWVLTATNLATPIGSWPTQATYTYDPTGAFSVTNAISPGTPQLFYRIKQ